MDVSLYDYQLEAIENMHNGCILCGDTGSGKSRTSLAYFYFKECEGRISINGDRIHEPMKKPRNLYVITTAKKRDTKDWDMECAQFGICKDISVSASGVSLTVDSWNNIRKYTKVYGAFFIFDEQHVSGSGAWVKAFLDIARKNHWILLSATPGDKWIDYIPVFVANGFYKNKSQFVAEHCVFARYAKYPKITAYMHEDKLQELRDKVLVHMDDFREKDKFEIVVPVDYDRETYRMILRNRWDPYENEPAADASRLCFLLRKCVNSDPSRQEALLDILDQRKKAIVFYNFNYELDLIKECLDADGVQYNEWNGKTHDPLPHGEKWAYLVQFMAGCEGWNCTSCDTVIYYSQNYSYRMTKQASGRIDRINSPYTELYYYRLKSSASIDSAIYGAYIHKKTFNESSFL